MITRYIAMLAAIFIVAVLLALTEQWIAYRRLADQCLSSTYHRHLYDNKGKVIFEVLQTTAFAWLLVLFVEQTIQWIQGG